MSNLDVLAKEATDQQQALQAKLAAAMDERARLNASIRNSEAGQQRNKLGKEIKQMRKLIEAKRIEAATFKKAKAALNQPQAQTISNNNLHRRVG